MSPPHRTLQRAHRDAHGTHGKTATEAGSCQDHGERAPRLATARTVGRVSKRARCVPAPRIQPDTLGPSKQRSRQRRARRGPCTLTCVSRDRSPRAGLHFHGAAAPRGATPGTHSGEGHREGRPAATRSDPRFCTATSEVVKHTHIRGREDSHNRKRSSHLGKTEANHVSRKRNSPRAEGAGRREAPT